MTDPETPSDPTPDPQTLPDAVRIAAQADPELALKPAEPKQNWIKMGVDFGPLICFGATFVVVPHVLKFADKETPLIWASGVLAAASLVALVVGLIAEKRLAWIPLISALLGIPFAILTVVFKDPVFIKIKMTLIDVVIGGILLGGLAMGKLPLKVLLADNLPLKPEAWPRLTLYYAIFYLAMAACNEVVWRTQTDGVWVTWKMASMIGGPILFSVALLPFMMKNMIMPDDAATPQKPKSSASK